MEASRERIRCYEFGPFRVDAQTRMLSRDGAVVSLTPKALEILLVLLRHHGLVVEKEQLFNDVWPHTVVDENNLARNISSLRKALGEVPAAHQYVVTVPGRGYRFVANVREIGHDPTSLPASPDEAAASGVAAPARVAPPSSRSLALVGGLVCGITVAVGLLSSTAPRADVRALPQRRLYQMTFAPGLESEPTWSRDGQMLAYSADPSGNFDIWVQPVREGKAVQVTRSSAHDWQPDWSPDGARLAFRSERDGGGLFVVPALGGAERRISTFGHRPRWSPDGREILFLSSSLRNVAELPRVYIVAPGQPPRDVLATFLAEFASIHVAWHPGGGRLSVWGRHRRWGWSFWTAPLDGGLPVKAEVDPRVAATLEEAGVTFDEFLWSRAGDVLYFEGVARDVQNLWKVRVDPRTGRWISGPERLTTGAGSETGMGLSPDGRTLAFAIRSGRTRLWDLPFDAATGRVEGEGRPLTAPGSDAFLADLSRDGRRVAFLALRDGRNEILGRPLPDGPERLLVDSGEFRRSPPRWSRDGAFLAYRRGRTTNAEGDGWETSIVALSVKDGVEQVITSGLPLGEGAHDWSADGEWILGNSERHTPGRQAIAWFPRAAAPAADRRMRIVASHPDYNLWQARLSPDERWVSFVAIQANDAGSTEIHVVPRWGGGWTQVTEGRYWDDKPRWAPDGRTLYFISNRAGFFNVWGVRFDSARGIATGEPFRVTAFESPGRMIEPSATSLELTLSADRLVLPITEVTGGIWILENVDQ